MAMLALGKWGNARDARLFRDTREQVGRIDDPRVEEAVKDGAIVLRPIRVDIRIVRVPRLASVFRNRSEEYATTEELLWSAVGEEVL